MEYAKQAESIDRACCICRAIPTLLAFSYLGPVISTGFAGLLTFFFFFA